MSAQSKEVGMRFTLYTLAAMLFMLPAGDLCAGAPKGPGPKKNPPVAAAQVGSLGGAGAVGGAFMHHSATALTPLGGPAKSGALAGKKPGEIGGPSFRPKKP